MREKRILKSAIVFVLVLVILTSAIVAVLVNNRPSNNVVADNNGNGGDVSNSATVISEGISNPSAEAMVADGKVPAGYLPVAGSVAIGDWVTLQTWLTTRQVGGVDAQNVHLTADITVDWEFGNAKRNDRAPAEADIPAGYTLDGNGFNVHNPISAGNQEIAEYCAFGFFSDSIAGVAKNFTFRLTGYAEKYWSSWYDDGFLYGHMGIFTREIALGGVVDNMRVDYEADITVENSGGNPWIYTGMVAGLSYGKIMNSTVNLSGWYKTKGTRNWANQAKTQPFTVVGGFVGDGWTPEGEIAIQNCTFNQVKASKCIGYDSGTTYTRGFGFAIGCSESRGIIDGFIINSSHTDILEVYDNYALLVGPQYPKGSNFDNTVYKNIYTAGATFSSSWTLARSAESGTTQLGITKITEADAPGISVSFDKTNPSNIIYTRANDDGKVFYDIKHITESEDTSVTHSAYMGKATKSVSVPKVTLTPRASAPNNAGGAYGISVTYATVGTFTPPTGVAPDISVEYGTGYDHDASSLFSVANYNAASIVGEYNKVATSTPVSEVNIRYTPSSRVLLYNDANNLVVVYNDAASVDPIDLVKVFVTKKNIVVNIEDFSYTTRAYNGSAVADVIFNGSVSGVNGETLTLSVNSPTFDNANAGVDKDITYGYSLSTSGTIGNYQINGTGLTTFTNQIMKGTIDKFAINAVTANDFTITNREYNADVDASASVINSTINGAVGETLTLSVSSATYNSKDAGTDKVVTINFEMTPDGAANANNYVISGLAALSGSIDVSNSVIAPIMIGDGGILADILLEGLTAIDPITKTYDGNTTFTAPIQGFEIDSNTAAGIGVIDGVVLKFGFVSVGNSDSVNVGNYTVDMTLEVLDNVNYALVNDGVASGNVSITTKGITIVFSGNNVYDAIANITGLVETESILLGGIVASNGDTRLTKAQEYNVAVDGNYTTDAQTYTVNAKTINVTIPNYSSFAVSGVEYSNGVITINEAVATIGVTATTTLIGYNDIALNVGEGTVSSIVIDNGVYSSTIGNIGAIDIIELTLAVGSYLVGIEDGVNGTTSVDKTVAQYGEYTTFTAEASEGYIFSHWTNESGAIVSYASTYVTKIFSNTTLTANFITQDVANNIAVNYFDITGKLSATRYVAAFDTSIASGDVNYLNKELHKIFAGWRVTMVNDTTYNLNPTFTTSGDSYTVKYNGADNTGISFNTTFSVSTLAENFIGWAINGTIVSIEKNYSFSVLGDTVIDMVTSGTQDSTDGKNFVAHVVEDSKSYVYGAVAYEGEFVSAKILLGDATTLTIETATQSLRVNGKRFGNLFTAIGRFQLQLAIGSKVAIVVESTVDGVTQYTYSDTITIA